MWHDGSRDADMKFVLHRCRFDGVENWGFARWHHDAHFYFVDCTFSRTMRDRAPFRVIYPINGGPVTDADRKRNAELEATNRWGNRAYFFNSHRDGGDYPWHRDNLAAAPGALRPAQITAKWTFGGKWDPEDPSGPAVRKVVAVDREITVTFGENVTVKGRPRLRLQDGTLAAYTQGSGTPALNFRRVSTGPGPAPTRFDFADGVILASEASARLRLAGANLP
jgi:pectinesterase